MKHLLNLFPRPWLIKLSIWFRPLILSDFILKEVDLQIQLMEVHIENFFHMDIKV